MCSQRQIFQVISAALLILGLTPPQMSARTIQNAGDTVCTPVLPRSNPAGEEPYTTFRFHDAGNIKMPIANWGVFGNPGFDLTDPETGWPIFTTYLNFGALWIGAVIGKGYRNDTLVSTGYDGFVSWDPDLTELYPDSYANGADFIERSNDPNSPWFDPEAISGQDFICVYTDTLDHPEYVPFDPATSKPHQPINIRVRQKSYVWPYGYAKNFIIIQYWIANMRDQTLRDVRVGILVAPQINDWRDDMVGFLHAAPTPTGKGFNIPMKTAWWADNDGDPSRGTSWYFYSKRSVMGLRFLGTGRSPCDESADTLEYSFNWWSPHIPYRLDWGPQRGPGDRSVYGGYGQPQGDAQKYRYMANGEIDYDQYLANDTIAGWIRSPGIQLSQKYAGYNNRYNIADGHDVRLLLSVGPFELEPGDSIPIGIALTLGEHFHVDPSNWNNLGGNTDVYYQNLNFKNLVRNMQMAAQVYDNPGVDTDGNGCAGLARVANCRDTMIWVEEECIKSGDTIRCIYDFWDFPEVCDSSYYAGDGIPDLTGPSPPPSPKITVHTEPNKIHIKWDGRESETYFDNFDQRWDFEGYNVYSGLGHDPNTLSLMFSWDLFNYDRYQYVPLARPSPWVINGPPFAPDKLHQMYGDEFDPTRHIDQFSYFEDQDGERYYFKPHSGNRSNEYVEHGFIVTNPIQYVRTDSLWSEMKRTWLYFGHYECTIDNLLPSQPYYVAVTAFDGGVPGGELEPLESNLRSNMELAYPSYSPDYVAANRMKVSVYPNPYKIDARYRDRRFEDPNREGFKERTRRIHFVNLPPEATIKIYSLDGDLIREIHHPESRFSDTPSHTAWDLISRNTQAVTSGIYLYSVESDWGTQIGKIVIIK